MTDLSKIAPEFVAMAHSIVWASAATVDARKRPRTRVLHPLWIWDGETLHGWIATGPTLPKRAQLAVSPFIALFCNLIRLTSTGLAYAYSTETFAADFHEVAGWMMLPLAIVLVQAIVRFMRWLDLPVYTWRFLQA